MIEYYEALADASPRVTTMSIGRTDEDRNIVVVAIGSAETVAELPRHRDNLGQLADPRGLTDSGALEIIEQTKPIYHLTARGASDRR